MRIIGIDPGTKCGWAVLVDGMGGQPMLAGSGVWDLKSRRHEGGGMRYLRFRRYIEELLSVGSLVAYEEVRRHMGVDAAHVYGGIVGQLGSVCEQLQIPYRAIPIGTVKKLATGKGNAKKEAMLKAAIKRFGLPDDVTDDEADACFIALALHEEITA